MIQNKLPSLASLLIAFIMGVIASVAITLPAQEPFDTLPPPNDDAVQQDLIQNSSAPKTDGNDVSAVQESLLDDDADIPDQKTNVVEEWAGWQGAGYGINGGRLSDNLRANWVMVDSNGGIRGRVLPIGNADVTGMRVYLLNNGRVVTTEDVSSSGDFQLNNVVEGAYSLVGYGDNAFFAFGFNVLKHSITANGIPMSIEVAAFQNKTTINNDWIKHFSPGIKFRVFGRYQVSEEFTDPPRLYGFDGLIAHQPSAIPATSIKYAPTAKSNDGRFVGRIHQMNSIHGRPVEVRNTKVILLRDDSVVDSVTTDSFGVFEFNNIAAGEYGLVAASVDGLGMVGVNIVDADGSEGLPFDFCMMTSETVGWVHNFAIEEAYRRVVLSSRPNDMANQQCPNCGVPCGNANCNQCGWQAGGYPGMGMYGKKEGHFKKSIRRLNEHVDRMFYPEDYQYRPRPYQNPYNYTRGR